MGKGVTICSRDHAFSLRVKRFCTRDHAFGPRDCVLVHMVIRFVYLIVDSVHVITHISVMRFDHVIIRI